MRPILLAFALSLSALVSAQAPLVPWPRNVEWQEGDFALKQVGVIEGEGAQGWGAQLRKELSSLGATSIAADEILRSVQLIRDSTQGEEGYTIAMEKDVVRIAAGSRIGALHATRTLEQLAAPDSIGNWHWPRVRIQDAPAFAWRGTMLDVSRPFYSVAFIKQYLDELAALKMNVFHWHLTDDQGWRVEVKKFPKLTEVGAWRTEADGARYGGFYTQEEVKDVVRYAEQRGITVVPEIEFPGHCSAALAAYPQLGCRKDTIAVPTTWGVFHDVYCVGQEETWSFFQSVLDELLPLFPAPWFHIGGDEVPKDRWQHCAVCQARAYHAHLAEQHIEELRHLVQVALAQEGANLGHARVVLGGLFAVRLLVHPHAAEFVATELLLALAQAGLFEEDRTRAAELHGQGEERNEPAEYEDDHAQGENDVEGALQGTVPALVQRLVPQFAHRHTAMELQVLGLYHRYEAVHTGDHPEPDGVALAILQQFGDRFLLAAGQGTVHDVDPVLHGKDLRRFEVTQALRTQQALHRPVVEQPTEAVSTHGLILAVAEDLLGCWAIPHDDEILYRGQRFQGKHLVDATADRQEGALAGAQHRGQILIAFRPGTASLAKQASGTFVRTRG